MGEPIYVDGPFPCLPNKRWRWKTVCHLFSADRDALHALAADIGLRRSWFQEKPGKLPHYDLTGSKARQAIASGAIRLGLKEAAAKHAEIRGMT